MKKKNGGFIATSLIYSFFLVFIAVIAAILNNYIANKTIMDRFNTEAAKYLNTNRYTVSVYSKNANITDGMTLTNLASNGTFTSNAYWQQEGTANFSYANNRLGFYSLYKINNGYSSSRLYQQLYFLQNSKFYYSISHLAASNSSFRTFIGSEAEGYLDTAGSKPDVWTKASNIYETGNSSVTKNLYVGSSATPGSVFLTNMMVVNLTASFGRGYEPDRKWIDENIEYFDGTVSYIRHEQVESGESITIKLSPFSGYANRYNITCINPKTNGSISGYNITNKIEGGRQIKEFKINSVTSDIKCNIDWRM